MTKLAIDFGTSSTKIYKLGYGIVLSEATCVTEQKDTGEVRAFGNEAKRLLGKTADLTNVTFPVWEGEIVSEKRAAALLEYFLQKVARRGAEALFCVPTGCTAASREKYFRVAKSAGISRVRFAETHFLSALGQDVPLSESNPIFAIDIGAGKTSLSAFSLDGTIAGLTMNVGGNNIDIHIIDHIAEMFNLKIGSLTSEKLKNTVGSLLKGAGRSTIINGRDVPTGRPRSVSVTSEDIYFPVSTYIDKTIEYADLLLKKLPAEVSAAMCKNGVYFSGGVCEIEGFAEYAEDKLQMEVHVAQNPETAVVSGGGRALGNSALLERIMME